MKYYLFAITIIFIVIGATLESTKKSLVERQTEWDKHLSIVVDVIDVIELIEDKSVWKGMNSS